MYHGFSMFASPCLDGLLHYESTAPALAMAAAFIMFLLDFFGARAAGSAGHGAEAHVHGVVGGGGEAAIASKTNSAAEADASEKGDAIAHHDHEDHAHSHVDESEKQQRWQVLLLEAGIIFHS
jgi:zinc transporter 1/2/3